MRRPRSRDTEPSAEEAVVFPADFVARMRVLLGDETEACLAALAAPPAGLRVNTLRVAPERLREIAPFGLTPLAFPPAGYMVEAGARPGKHPYHAAGLYYLQDPGAMAVGALVAPRPGERVLDLAAAPGGKATHLAALMRDEGVLVANDVHAGRARELAGNLERIGARAAVVTNETAARLAEHFGAWFDRVLVDAPCSGESMFHKSGAARQDWSPAAVLGCARRQDELLAEAARLVRPGGRLVYSTCTFSPEENETVVARFLAGAPEFELEALPAVPGGAPARAEWAAPEHAGLPLHHALRLWPHRVAGAGHFVASLRRTDGEEAELRPAVGATLSRRQREMLDAFAAEQLRGVALGEGPLEPRGAELYALPAAAPPLGRLRTVRPGWWLGTLHDTRFEPSHALALGLAPAAAREALELRADGERVLAYLRGETLASEGPAGWLLVTVDGFALGWGKRVGAVVKNHYPKGLRRL